MWIDSHCHLDAPEFAGAGRTLAQQALAAGVGGVLIPAVERANFAACAALAQDVPQCAYTLGIHPLYVGRAHEDDLHFLRDQIRAALADAAFAGVGEIGLDFFEPALCSPEMRERQLYFFQAQLKLAREFGLPVLLHVRRSQDQILAQLRRITPPGGIAHAFNGSLQQAQQFIALGCKLGMGGAMTYPRALQIRRLAVELPLSALVLETDAPDIPPEWLHARHGGSGPNTPAQCARIGAVLAQLRAAPLEQVAAQTSENVCQVLPRLRQRLTGQAAPR
ncbi:TatD family hydrolase [Massilia sp. W12]|uniref:TatD family hydrolase n=1 Tax=Massilia sp. W12 TaxID=3126507 RepID=UPI0030CE3A68